VFFAVLAQRAGKGKSPEKQIAMIAQKVIDAKYPQ
jgi:hypothetical protein